ncbi:N-acylglucosamine 2-epimerase [Emticicia oligotrophica DSM 17448]|uniref:N-acylglucosamine 2-epimerase n=1 Tax=Emticicia oligotrophica (strain DSM 17448 / CIP 109782 / MTCC 6937 / GPTSA100-15) TaxID=929562 RepID=A0ABN4AJY8_EMTOG|nr:AGE family epimerase/isomerase [Emticicia oligotrophica]AFK02392.1 N-acylglucosamine 2-epimerase [Emticicia oligotrophica DSM 17448]
MNPIQARELRDEIENYLNNSLLPFWITRTVDNQYGGFLTHFDQYGNDSGEDEKSLIAQSRSVFTYSSAHRAGYGGGKLAEMARHGVDFMLNKMWDEEYGGFYWMMNRKGEVVIDEKIVYGHSFAIYSLSEYTLATGDPRGREYAEKVFDLLQKHVVDTNYGGYWEMFHRNWDLKGPGAAGGDRKTLDAHMHLMEAFTTLYECTGQQVHRRKLLEIIEILTKKIMHPKYGTGIPQFWADWSVAPQIKFDIVWGWDRFTEDGQKAAAEDNTSYGHNSEFAWLLMHALDILKLPYDLHHEQIQKSFSHSVDYGIDWEFGGVYVEGSHAGEVYDREKEFWQQAEMLIGMLDAYRYLKDEKYWNAYVNVHRFVFDKMINHSLGEWWPLMTRQGEPIWKHMSHSWKINYHDVRSMIQSVVRLNKLLEA